MSLTLLQSKITIQKIVKFSVRKNHMRKKTAAALLLGALSFVLLFVGFDGNKADPVAYKRISASQAKAVMDDSEPYVLLDVRTKEEFQGHHIKGAALIPHTEIKYRVASAVPTKDTPVLIYCRSGRRSAIAAKELIGIGYTRVYDFGGINDWPYKVVTGAGNSKQ